MNIILSIQKNKSCSLQVCAAKKALRRLLFITIIGISCHQVIGQVDQRLALADKYYAAGEYYTAAHMYEQFLNPSKKEVSKANFPLNSRRYNRGATGGAVNKLDVLYKQAESYRLANYWIDAADKYKKCFEKDQSKYSDALYWYAVCQRSLGKYDVAEENLNQFLSSAISGSIKRPDAEKELQTIQFIKKQISRPDTVMYSIKKISTPVNDGKGIFALANIGGSQFGFTSTTTDSIITNGVNPNHSRLFYATIENNTLQNPEPVNIDGVDYSFNQGTACVSPDKNFLYFTQWKKENGKNISSIYFSSKNKNGWSKPILLSSINKEGFSSKQPSCSADGKTLFFASDMPGGAGGFDIWSAPLQADGTAGMPVNAGTIINTEADEQAPFYHSASGNLVFASNGRQGMGGFDLYSAKMNGSGWNTPENMGYPVNSSRDDIYFFAMEEKELLKNAIIGSDRGSECCLETYSVVKTSKKQIMNGVVRNCRDNNPISNAQVIMKDPSGKNWKTTTNPDGKFSFDLANDPEQNTIVVTKEQYKEKSVGVSVENVNGSDWQTDILQNVPICIDTIEEKTLVIKAENVVTVYFDFDKSDLKERGVSLLDSVSKVLAEDITATVQISGYTDGLGSDAYNKKLSDRRARTCADYLISKGVDVTRISFESFGACCPVEMEKINGRDNPDGRSKNRRAMINIAKE
ncbi:MAG: OmpA family protein [Chitinophagales bacterium]